MRPLLIAQIPTHLLNLINSINHRSIATSTSSAAGEAAPILRLLPPLLRALRNILIATADTAWGQSWGVGAEKQVVDTGLMGEVGGAESAGPTRSKAKGKGTAKETVQWREIVSQTLPLVFEVSLFSPLKKCLGETKLIMD